jgi:hypothetical protein
MSFIRTMVRNATALLGLVAVFLGALEHEDLIFQEPITVQADAETDHTGNGPGAANGGQLDALSPVSGTESIFRSEPHRQVVAQPGRACPDVLPDVFAGVVKPIARSGAVCLAPRLDRFAIFALRL